MRTLEIVLMTIGVFVASLMFYFFFPVAITALGIVSIILVAREIGAHYDEVYRKATQEKVLDAHSRIQVIRVKHHASHPKSA